MPVTTEVVKNESAGRYELHIDGRTVGIAEFEVRGDTVVFPHTVIDPAERGGGLGARLVSGALDDVRSSGRVVVPECWYVAQFIDEHEEYADLLAG